MPKSSVRKKKVYTPPAEIRPASVTGAGKKPSPAWLPVTGVILVIVGILWIVVFYLSGGEYPVLSWRYWNLVVGFGLMVAALALFSRWR